jgi:hypothetical protein
MTTKAWIGVIGATALVFATSAALAAQQVEKKPKGRASQVGDRGLDEAQAPAPGEAQNMDAIKYTYHPGGMVSAELDASFEEALVVTKLSDGSYSYTCIHGLPVASKLVNRGTMDQAATKPPPARKAEVK